MGKQRYARMDFPYTDYPASIVLGPPKLMSRLGPHAEARKAVTRTPKTLRIGDMTAVALPHGWASIWTPQPWGALLVRHDASGTIPEMLRAEDGAQRAVEHVSRWRPIATNWKVGSQTTAILLEIASRISRKNRPSEVLQLAAGEYRVEAAEVKVVGFTYDIYRFVQEGASPNAPTKSRRAHRDAAEPPEIPTEARRLARTLPFLHRRPKNPLLVIDAAVSRKWNGIYDADGTNALAKGDPCDYDSLPTAERVLVSIGERGTNEKALLLSPSLAATWIPVSRSEGIVVQLHSGASLAVAIAGALFVRDADWRATRQVITIGHRGARLLDAAARGSRARKDEALPIGLARGRYVVTRKEVEGVVLVGGKRSEYVIELHRLRKR